MERCVFKYLYNFIHDNDILTPSQSGFRPNDSTVNQLLSITSDFYRALDQGKEVRIVFFDISKAFDQVWHRGLLFKLQNIGIDGGLLKWFKSYLYRRKQRVVIHWVMSDVVEIQSGVPQGSILGPLLFLVYINDLVTDIECEIKLFADDTSLYVVVENPYTSALQINRDLIKINEWACRWLVTFNPNKTECLTISNNIKKPFHPSLIFDDIYLQEVEAHKHLGVILANNLSWNLHVNEILSKGYSRLSMLRNVKFILDRKTLQTIYFSFIRPVLEYADAVWDNIPDYLADKIESLQLEAARIVSGGNRMASKNLLYKETGWVTLSKRRENHRIIHFHKIYHKKSPNYLCDNIQDRNQQYNTRQSNLVQEIRTRTQFYYNSFFPSTIRLWNNLPPTIQNNPSLHKLKSYLNSYQSKIPNYFYVGSRLGQVLHSKLRLECSSLK